MCASIDSWQHSAGAGDGVQAFINTARKIYEKIEQGVFDVSNEVRAHTIHWQLRPIACL